MSYKLTSRECWDSNCHLESVFVDRCRLGKDSARKNLEGRMLSSVPFLVPAKRAKVLSAD